MLLIHWAYIYERCIKIGIYIIRMKKIKEVSFVRIIVFEIYNWYENDMKKKKTNQFST